MIIIWFIDDGLLYKFSLQNIFLHSTIYNQISPKVSENIFIQGQKIGLFLDFD